MNPWRCLGLVVWFALLGSRAVDVASEVPAAGALAQTTLNVLEAPMVPLVNMRATRSKQ